MARYAIVQGGVVVNVIEADPAFAATVGGIASDTASPGDTWDGQAFARPEPPALPVPAVVSKAQALIALSRADIEEADIDAAINGMPAGQARTEARLWWRHATEVRRDHPVVVLLAPELGIDPAALDALFTTAASL